VEVQMLSISWIKDEAGRLLAVWALRESDKPMIPQRTGPSFSPAHSRFHSVDWHSLRKAA